MDDGGKKPKRTQTQPSQWKRERGTEFNSNTINLTILQTIVFPCVSNNFLWQNQKLLRYNRLVFATKFCLDARFLCERTETSYIRIRGGFFLFVCFFGMHAPCTQCKQNRLERKKASGTRWWEKIMGSARCSIDIKELQKERKTEWME